MSARAQLQDFQAKKSGADSRCVEEEGAEVIDYRYVSLPVDIDA